MRLLLDRDRVLDRLLQYTQPIQLECQRGSLGDPVTVPDIAPSTTELPTNPVLATSETFICRGCYYILDLNRGAPNVPSGTAFDAIGADFRCPDCGTDRSNFRQYHADATLASSA